MLQTSKITMKELLINHIQHPWLAAIQTPWPVSVSVGQLEENEWNCVQCISKVTDVGHSFEVRLAGVRTGLECELHIDLDSYHKAVQLSGQMINNSKYELKDVKSPKIYDIKWAREVAKEPFIRRIAGGPWGDVAYPPIGLRCEDVQLLDHYQHWASIGVNSPLEDGRASIQHQPLMAIGDDRHTGIFLALEWAGSYRMECCRIQDFWAHQSPGALRTDAGVEGIHVDLKPGISMPLPTAWLLFYQGRLDEGCQSWRTFFGDRLAPMLDGKKVLPPTSYNHWLAYEIENFPEAAALAEASQCAELGIEYFVYDAGWYEGGFRNGNGNWEMTDRIKIPSGFSELSRRITQMGLKFGSWLEPEFAAMDSKLVKEHPEWFYLNSHQPEQNVLMNFSLHEVQDWWVSFVLNWVEKSGIRWIRWDFNQQPGPIWLQQDRPGAKGLAQLHHIRGLYATLDRIIEACPSLLIEQCASGGCRIEPGIMRRGHSYWINDHSSNPHFVRYYQHGMNQMWPAHYANVNVVSRTGKLSESEWLSHQNGSFGISSRIVDWSSEERQELQRQLKRFKSFRHLLQGSFGSTTRQPIDLSQKHMLSFSGPEGKVGFHHNLSVQEADLSIEIN